MAIFSDDFTTDTVDEYEITQGGSRAGAGSVTWEADAEQLFVYAPNNVTVFLSRDDVSFPESGHVRMEFVVHGDYHVTDEVGVRWRQDDDNWLDWRGTGDGSGSSFASSYGDQVRAVLDGETVARERRVPGTVGPGPDVRTLDAYWTPSSMSIAIDGEEAASAEVDLSTFAPSTISFVVNQGDVDLRSVEVSVGDGGAERVTAKATTLTLLPGYNERSEDPDGDELNSSIPDLSILDGAFIADDRLELPETLDDAVGATRGPFPEYPGEEFKAYRLMNQIELSFETEDGKTITDWSTVEIRINDEEDPISSDSEWQPSYILVEGESEHGEENPVRRLIDSPDYEWFDGEDKLRGDIRQWNDEVSEADFDRVLVGNVEGIRASLIRGGRDTFVQNMKQRILKMGFLEQQLFFNEFDIGLFAQQGIFRGPPYFYTFIDLIVMADSSRYVRVWDASPYPKHYLYVGNDQVRQNEFEEDEEWNRGEHPISNARFMATFDESNDGRSPFSPHSGRMYEWFFDIDSGSSGPGPRPPAAFGPHPVLEYVDGGDVLTETDLEEHQAFKDPNFPW